MKFQIDWAVARSSLYISIVAAICAYLGQPLIHKNATAINLLVTVFSILAGFLIAILAVVGDPAMLSMGSWRAAEIDQHRIKKRLIRHKILFEGYLITLLLIFVASLWNEQKECPSFIVWMEYSALFFGTMSFIYSFKLPKILKEAQEERLNAEIERRRKRSGIK